MKKKIHRVNFSIPKPLLDEVRIFKMETRESVSALVCEFLKKVVKRHKKNVSNIKQ